jgi:DNA-binding response OmpR family regulator
MLPDLHQPIKPKILIADDEPRWLRVLSLYLRRRHYEIDTALNGQEALQRIETHRPDLIIADITMPGMDGYDLCRHLRRHASTRTIPFIFLTARDHETERLKGRRIGADDYLTKPCSLARVMQSVETAMERIEQARSLSFDRIGMNGRIDEIDLLDLIQALELEQKTGALVLSHGERTGTLYLKDGVIVEADIRSPVREEPLFRLLGWKTGRFVFVPDAVPDMAPITASMAHLLFEDLQLLKEHEHRLADQSTDTSDHVEAAAGHSPVGRLLAQLESVGQQSPWSQLQSEKPCILRMLVVGTAAAATNDLIQALVMDLSPARWAALEIQEPHLSYRQEIGRVRLSARTVLHLAAVRGERRFWSVWEQCVPGSIGAIVVLPGLSEPDRAHLRSFLSARDIIEPGMPVVVSVPTAALEAGPSPLPVVTIVAGSLDEQPVRLQILSRLLDLRLTLDSNSPGES